MLTHREVVRARQWLAHSMIELFSKEGVQVCSFPFLVRGPSRECVSALAPGAGGAHPAGGRGLLRWRAAGGLRLPGIPEPGVRRTVESIPRRTLSNPRRTLSHRSLRRKNTQAELGWCSLRANFESFSAAMRIHRDPGRRRLLRATRSRAIQ